MKNIGRVIYSQNKKEILYEKEKSYLRFFALFFEKKISLAYLICSRFWSLGEILV